MDGQVCRGMQGQGIQSEQTVLMLVATVSSYLGSRREEKGCPPAVLFLEKSPENACASGAHGEGSE